MVHATNVAVTRTGVHLCYQASDSTSLAGWTPGLVLIFLGHYAIFLLLLSRFFSLPVVFYKVTMMFLGVDLFISNILKVCSGFLDV